MGHKAHPIGLRLGVHRKWKSCWYFESKNYSKFLHLNFNIEKFFKGFLHYYPIKTLLINCQIVKLPTNHIFVFIFFYRLRKKKKKIKKFLWKIKNWQKNVYNNLGKKELPFQFAANQANKAYFKIFLKKISTIEYKWFQKKNKNIPKLFKKNLFTLKTYLTCFLLIKKNPFFLSKNLLYVLKFKLSYIVQQNLIVNLSLQKKNYIKNIFFLSILRQLSLANNFLKKNYNLNQYLCYYRLKKFLKKKKKKISYFTFKKYN